MRYTSENSLKDKTGHTFVKRCFLFLPHTYRSKKTRWLEYADIVFQYRWKGDPDGNYIICADIGFADEPESLYETSSFHLVGNDWNSY